jgi:hypothetical protein
MASSGSSGRTEVEPRHDPGAGLHGLGLDDAPVGEHHLPADDARPGRAERALEPAAALAQRNAYDAEALHRRTGFQPPCHRVSKVRGVRSPDSEITVRALHDLDLLEYLRRQAQRPAEEAVEDPVDREEPPGPPLQTPSRNRNR